MVASHLSVGSPAYLNGSNPMNEPLFPSYEEMNRRLNAAKQLRIDFLHRIARNAKRKFAAQSRTMRRVEASAAVMAFAVGGFWLVFLSTPKVTEASQFVTLGIEAAGTTR